MAKDRTVDTASETPEGDRVAEGRRLHEISVDLEVPFHDVDPMGIVWHGHYYRYFDAARTQLLRSCGLDAGKLIGGKYVFMVAESRCRHLFRLRKDPRRDRQRPRRRRGAGVAYRRARGEGPSLRRGRPLLGRRARGRKMVARREGRRLL